jgi:hypothetical protein
MYSLRIQPHINTVTAQESLFQKGFLKISSDYSEERHFTLYCISNLLNALLIEVLIILSHIYKICMNPPLVPHTLDHVIHFVQFAESANQLCMCSTVLL